MVEVTSPEVSDRWFVVRKFLQKSRVSMHTIKMIILGLAVLMIFLVVGRSATTPRGIATAAFSFLSLWLIIAATNTYMIGADAGYSVTDEMPVFLFVFAVPALVAFVLWRKSR
jgi:hypothetical protein